MLVARKVSSNSDALYEKSAKLIVQEMKMVNVLLAQEDEGKAIMDYLYDEGGYQAFHTSMFLIFDKIPAGLLGWISRTAAQKDFIKTLEKYELLINAILKSLD